MLNYESKKVKTRRSFDLRERLTHFLKKISLGKYSTVMYNNRGTSSHSSIIGGVLTAIFSIGMFIYAVFVLKNVLNRTNYNLYE